jgi:enoyl-CoA hydratase/carnithine racemase
LNPGLVLNQLFELGGTGLVTVDLDSAQARAPAAAPGQVIIGVAGSGALPTQGLSAFDILLCDQSAPPQPWVGLGGDSLPKALGDLQTQAERHVGAVSTLAQVLRMTLRLAFGQALVLESMAYSMLLASNDFKAWRAANRPRVRAEPDTPRVRLEIEDDLVSITLNRPWARNAFDGRMRDALVDALSLALDYPSRPRIGLSGAGSAFSAGGDLDEFGQAEDVTEAHLIRTLQSPARLLRLAGVRATVRAHGACIGAGIEFAAAAHRLTVAPGAFFRLPEIGMGLIPGAGGTATIPRRIGRHRTCYMALSGADIDLETALSWGLVDAVEAPV